MADVDGKEGDKVPVAGEDDVPQPNEPPTPVDANTPNDEVGIDPIETMPVEKSKSDNEFLRDIFTHGTILLSNTIKYFLFPLIVLSICLYSIMMFFYIFLPTPNLNSTFSGTGPSNIDLIWFNFLGLCTIVL